MPSRNSVKTYVDSGYYHVYNRGVDKRDIFMDDQDYAVFLGYMQEYLMPKDDANMQAQLADPKTTSAQKQKILKLIRMNNFHEEITLLAYCLMPNHFHLFLKQKSKESLDKFMNSILTRYVMYFNRKYKRSGRLFQGVYKAVLVETEPYFLHLSAYIHRNPLSLENPDEAFLTQPSSYTDYIGTTQTPWVQPGQILSYFSKTNPTLSYESFVGQATDFGMIRDEKIDEHEWNGTVPSTEPTEPSRGPLDSPQGDPLGTTPLEIEPEETPVEPVVKKKGFFQKLFDI